MSNKFQYLPYVIPYALGIYCLLVGAIYYRFRVAFNQNKIRASIQSTYQESPKNSLLENDDLTPARAFLCGEPFEILYGMSDMWRILPSSSIGEEASSRLNLQREKTVMYSLLFWRTINLLYFFGVSFLWGYIYFEGNNAYFFTIWNIDIICLYYLLMVIATIIGVFYDEELREHKRIFAKGDVPFWSDKMMNFGFFLQILYSFVGATALFITVVAFTTLEHKFEIWNVSFHFVTSISFIFDAMLNRLQVRWEHLVMNMSWIFLYLIFIWSMVGSGTLKKWPYFFLDTDTIAVFVWYPLLFTLNILFYGLWIGVNHFKVAVAKYKMNHYLKNAGLQSTLYFDRKDFLSPLVGNDNDHDNRFKVDVSVKS